ncbi:DMT family transporter [Nocardia puris]|nr:DMT family transporter [Nocardia puris]MBF6365288.1 DMT family transporter [Nocardia puris]MBF6459690.1 DMT family transporter [Nocardia puris]
MRTRWGLVFGFCIGAGVAVQGRINGALGARLQDGIAAATVSFGTGLLILVIAFAMSARLRAGFGAARAALAEGTLRPWHLLGGLCGAFFVAGQGLTIAAIGVTVFTVAAVAGQLLSSLAVDRLGLAPGGATPVTASRALAAVLAIGAVVLTSGRGGEQPGALALPELFGATPHFLLVALPALAGIGLAWQQAVNGRVGAAGGPFSAALVNFTVGLIALVLIESALLAYTGGLPAFPTEPWLYLGGLIGVAFIALAALTVRWIGVLLLGLTSVAGQLATALTLDLLTPDTPAPSALSVLGCLLTLAAVTLAARHRT